MGNFVEIAESILKRYVKETLSKNPIDDFTEHVWTEEFTVKSLKIKREFFISSKKPGIIQFYVVNEINGHAASSDGIMLAQFSVVNLTRNVIAKCMESIVESMK